MNPFPIGKINWEHPEKATEVYHGLKEKYGYPEIEDKENETSVKGRFYAIAFAYIITEYRKIITTYEDWEDRSYEQSQIGITLGMPKHKQDFFSQLGIDFEYDRED